MGSTLDGPRAVSYWSEDDAKAMSAEEARKKYSAWNQYAWSPFTANKGLLYFNAKIGEAYYLRETEPKEREGEQPSDAIPNNEAHDDK